MTYSQFTF